LIESRCEELKLELMVSDNTTLHETPFTVSVDLLGKGCTTGISAQDRAKTVQALIDPATRPEELGKPGHIFPLKAKPEGFFAGQDTQKRPLIWLVWLGSNQQDVLLKY
jgi:3,4-dihydroxy 2-butanone 4-phosphate synthase/GTP cyclohydrolase II